MKSTSNNYYVGLDHIRALAAYLVFCWHFLHAGSGSLIPFGEPYFLPPASLLNEGHVGVSIFMALSGYLFAKIIDDRKVNYVYFYWNRFLRLAPLMVFVVGINALIRIYNGSDGVWYFFASLANGLVYPSLPNSGWSITVEFHFYLILPCLLWMGRKSNWFLVGLVILFIAYRWLLFSQDSTVRYLAYWTIIGRLDIFILGMLAFRYRQYLSQNAFIPIFSLLLLCGTYAYLNFLGGYRDTWGANIWVYLATVEAISIAPLIAWYDSKSESYKGVISSTVATIGKYSYSMYLLHHFFVFNAAVYIHSNIVNLNNFFSATIVATISFIAFVPVTHLSYKLIEKPCLKFRVKYF